MSYSSCQHMKFPTRGTNEGILSYFSLLLTLDSFFFPKPTFPSFNYQN